jgi:hypothetical protein
VCVSCAESRRKRAHRSIRFPNRQTDLVGGQ